MKFELKSVRASYVNGPHDQANEFHICYTEAQSGQKGIGNGLLHDLREKEMGSIHCWQGETI